MAKLEDVLPALREGKRIRRAHWIGWYIRRSDFYIYDEQGNRYTLNFPEALHATDWEIVQEPTRVADYLVAIPYSDQIYCRQTFPIGQQPEGSVMVPGSEREATE